MNSGPLGHAFYKENVLFHVKRVAWKVRFVILIIGSHYDLTGLLLWWVIVPCYYLFYPTLQFWNEDKC